MILVIKSAYNSCGESSTHVCAKVTKKRRQGVLIEKIFNKKAPFGGKKKFL